MTAQEKLIEKTVTLESFTQGVGSPTSTTSTVCRTLSFDGVSEGTPSPATISTGSAKTQRKKVFTEEEKAAIAMMSEPSEMEPGVSWRITVTCSFASGTKTPV